MISCPKCGSFRYQKRGIKSNGNPQFFCTSQEHPIGESRWWTDKAEKQILNETKTKEVLSPKILLFDIETSHMLVKTFSLYNDAIPHTDIVDDWFILSFSAKWLYDDVMIEYCVTPKEAKERDDFRIVKELNNLLNKADIIIAHNGSAFDVKKANTRFAFYDLAPPFNYREIDTLRMARTYFKFSSNRLDYLGEFLGLGRKIQNEKGLWDRCEDGEKESLEKMVEYCSQDVRLLENIYLKLRPFAKNHPSLALYGEIENTNYCPVCGATDTIKLDLSKIYDNRFLVGRCSSCNAPVRGKKDYLPVEIKRKMFKRN